MSQTTREINRITTTIMGVACKVLLYVLVFFLLYEGITRGYSYGHEIFAPTAVTAQPGYEVTIEIKDSNSVMDVARLLKKKGLIKDELIFVLQARIYEYELHAGIYTLSSAQTSKDMLKYIDEGGEKVE